MDEIEWAQQFAPAGAPTLNDIFARALVADRADLDEARRAREDEAAREDRRLAMAMANRRAGDPIGEVNRCQMAIASCRDEVTDLEARLEGARGRLHRAAEQLVDWQAQADEVLAVSAQRSQMPDMLAEAKRVAAEVRVDAMLAQRSAGATAARAAPFWRRGKQVSPGVRLLPA